MTRKWTRSQAVIVRKLCSINTEALKIAVEKVDSDTLAQLCQYIGFVALISEEVERDWRMHKETAERLAERTRRARLRIPITPKPRAIPKWSSL